MGGWQIEGNHAKAFLSIRLVQHSYQCFAEWDSQDMQSFWRFVTTLHNLTWQQIFATATKDPKYKTGVGYTVIEARNYPNEDFKDTLDPETTFFELRVDQQRRVHGFRDKSIFYLCWLDRNHALT